MGIPILGDLWGKVTGFFADVAGAAIDSVLAAVTAWVMSGVLAIIEAVWSVIDNTTRVQPGAEWFSLTPDSPAAIAVAVGVTVTAITLLLAIVRAVLAGSPGGAVRAVAVDLPTAVFAAAATVGVATVLLDLSDAVAAWVWGAGRGNAQQALENMSKVLMSGLPGTHFLGIVLAVMLLGSLVFVWIVLFIRQSLIYIVLVLALAFAWPVGIFPPLRDTAKKTLELLVALIVSKVVMMLAMSVGIAALGGVGATAPPAEIDCQGAGWAECLAANAEQANVNLQIELGALMTGIVAFGLAAFMPFLIWKLMPLAAAAVVAQGVASGPLRASQQAMQFSYYGRQTMNRLTTVPARSPAAGGAAAVAGPVGVAAAAGQTVAQSAERTAEAAVPPRLTTSSTPSSGRPSNGDGGGGS